MNKLKLCLAGDGWGAIAAYRALSRSFTGIQIVTNDPDLLSNINATDCRIENLRISDAEIVVCAGYKPIIPPDQLNKATHINIHYSLLPKYRGMHSTVWAILNGEEYCGCTIHLMNEYIDDGHILKQFKTKTGDKTSTMIMEECNKWVAENLDQVVIGYLSGNITPIKQDKSQATWVPKRNLDDCFIDFNLSTIEISRIFRALTPPYPLPRFGYKGRVYEITKAEVIHRPYFCTNGRVVNIDNEGIWVKIRDGLLLIKEVRCEGRVADPTDFKIGARLNRG